MQFQPADAGRVASRARGHSFRGGHVKEPFARWGRRRPVRTQPRGSRRSPCLPAPRSSTRADQRRRRNASPQVKGEEWMSRPIRRVLFLTTVAGDEATAIHLGRPLLTGSSVLPAHSTGPASRRPRTPIVCCLDLLRVGFTEPLQSPGALVVSYTTVSPLPAAEAAGGLFSVALSRGSPRVAVGHHPALWSPDVPRQGRGPDATVWPTHPPSA
jgi:hypothetical protein